MSTASAKKPAVYSAGAAEGGYAVLRDGAALTTPAGRLFVVPTEKLAQAIAAEAAASPKDALLRQLAATAIDIVTFGRAKIIDELTAYAETELLCHRAEYPAELARQQAAVWQPLLDWCGERFGAPLKAGTGIMPVAQPAESLKALRQAMEPCDNFRLAGLRQAVNAAGSLVLGLALSEGRLDEGEAFHAAELDAAWQSRQWGEDPVMAVRHDATRRDLALCAQWFTLLEKQAS